MGMSHSRGRYLIRNLFTADNFIVFPPYVGVLVLPSGVGMDIRVSFNETHHMFKLTVVECNRAPKALHSGRISSRSVIEVLQPCSPKWLMADVGLRVTNQELYWPPRAGLGGTETRLPSNILSISFSQASLSPSSRKHSPYTRFPRVFFQMTLIWTVGTFPNTTYDTYGAHEWTPHKFLTNSQFIKPSLTKLYTDPTFFVHFFIAMRRVWSDGKHQSFCWGVRCPLASGAARPHRSPI